MRQRRTLRPPKAQMRRIHARKHRQRVVLTRGGCTELELQMATQRLKVEVQQHQFLVARLRFTEGEGPRRASCHVVNCRLLFLQDSLLEPLDDATCCSVRCMGEHMAYLSAKPANNLRHKWPTWPFLSERHATSQTPHHPRVSYGLSLAACFTRHRWMV